MNSQDEFLDDLWSDLAGCSIKVRHWTDEDKRQADEMWRKVRYLRRRLIDAIYFGGIFKRE